MSSDTSNSHDFKPCPPDGERSPCPALNALANHGYIHRSGKNLSFFEVVHAISHVYNLSYPLSIVLALGGFVTVGKFRLTRSANRGKASTSSDAPPKGYVDKLILSILKTISYLGKFVPHLTLNLSDLSRRGQKMITHDASFVHPDVIPSTAPDPKLLKLLLEYASRSAKDSDGKPKNGLSLVDIARYHARRVDAAPAKLSAFHNKIALGESALTWLVLRGDTKHANSRVDEMEKGIYEQESSDSVPISRLEQWFGEERLPDKWWDSVRPAQVIGLRKVDKIARQVGSLGDI